MPRRKSRQQTIKIFERLLDGLVLDGVDRGLASGHIDRALAELQGPPSPAPASSKPSPTAVGAQVQVVLDQYRRLYREVTGGTEDPVITRADYGTLSQLLKAYGPQMVAARLEAFARWDDQFVREKVGLTLPAFYRHWNQLATVLAARQPKITPPADCRHDPPCPDAKTHSKKFLAEVKIHGSGSNESM